MLTARVGSTFSRTDGGAGTSFYVKESGTGNTGWVPKGYGLSTSVKLEDISDTINTADKSLNRFVINSTTGGVVRALGGGAGNNWVDMDGSVQHTPI